ncbi:MAG: hypothetical protein MUE72_09365 [Chitinophagaceae bacterium]|jgi:hypothetical protein|nr:hypothetical protein [Chitinophagaceae bacterium]
MPAIKLFYTIYLYYDVQSFKGTPYYREYVDKDGPVKPILGICNTKYEDPRAQYFRERIHIVGFINETKYVKDEINSQIYTFCNPNLIPKLDLKLPIEIKKL